MRFINGLQVNANGDSLPGAPVLSPQQQADFQLAEIRASRLGSIAASAEDRLAAGVNERDLNQLCASGGFTTSQQMDIKHRVLTLKQPLADVLRKVRRAA